MDKQQLAKSKDFFAFAFSPLTLFYGVLLSVRYLIKREVLKFEEIPGTENVSRFCTSLARSFRILCGLRPSYFMPYLGT